MSKKAYVSPTLETVGEPVNSVAVLVTIAAVNVVVVAGFGVVAAAVVITMPL